MEAQNSPAQRFLAALLEWPQLLKQFLRNRNNLVAFGRLSRQSSSNTDLLRELFLSISSDAVGLPTPPPKRSPASSSDAVMHVLRQIDETAYKLPSGLQLLSQLCVTATTASSSAVDMDARRGFDRAAQEAVISQLLAQPLRAEELLLSFVEDYPLGAVDVAALPPLALTWRGEPSSLTAFGASVVPLSVIAPARNPTGGDAELITPMNCRALMIGVAMASTARVMVVVAPVGCGKRPIPLLTKRSASQ